ncbi:MAG: hypothetical protein K2J40_10340 [Ruminococcus sp.]|nr:hypothetical protein [Ruminococcus sp.]
MTENFSIPLKYKEGTFRAEKIKDFSGETINLEYIGCEIFRYILSGHYEEVRIYGVPENPVFTAAYDSDGVIKHIELQRNNRTELMYINFPDRETAKENIWQYSCFWGDWISEKILERKEKIARIFIGYFYDGEAADQYVNVYTPEDVQKVIDKYNNGNNPADKLGNYPHDEEILPDNDTLRIMLLCTDDNFANDLFEFAVYVMTNRIKENILDKIDRADDFKLILKEHDGIEQIL